MQAREIELQFERQIREHELLLYKVCRMYTNTDADRQDLFQDMIVQLWQAYPTFKGHSKFSTWLYRVAINTAITRERKKKDFLTYREPLSMPMDLGEATSNLEDEERLQLLYKAIE